MIVFRKARTSTQTLNDLNAYISGLGDEPVKWLAREVRRWGEFSYDELERAIEDGQLDELIDWQGRYSDVINRVLAPQWAAAFAAAAQKVTRGKIIFTDSDDDVRAWLKTRGGELISLLSDESKRAIANVILHAQEHLMNPRKIAQQIRPLIGLNTAQAEANFKYRMKIYQRYLERGASESTAARQADKAALKYAATQHRFRAETITHTELAFAYNRGAHAGVTRAIGLNLMGRCAMVWTTAGTNRVCGRCMALKDTIVGYTDESGVTLPPLHPRCRCAISYREVGGLNSTLPRGTESPTISGTRTCKPLTPEQIKEIRDAEDNAYNAKTGADFGFKKMNVAADWAREIMLANGNEKNITRIMNCQRCVVAHEARMRGYDVIARPSWGENDSLRRVGNWLKVFEEDGREIYNCVGNTANEIEKFIRDKMKEWGKGSRAFVWFQWENFFGSDEFGHTIVIQLNENGFVNFGDPQTKKMGAIRCLSAAKLNSVVIMRVDNLSFTELVKRCCMNRRNTK